MVDFTTPYAMDGTVLPGSALRRQQQDVAGEGSGVVRAGDLKVSALDTPGQGVKIMPGHDLIQCRAPGRDRETYGVQLNAAANWLGDAGAGIPGTGSSATRRDMIIHEILDPELPRHFTPQAEWPAGASSKLSVVQNVPASAKTVADVPELSEVTCYELAAINWPASTATIAPGMVEDLRKIQTPQSLIVVRGYNVSSDDGHPDDPVNSQYPAADTWPITARESGALIVDIPEWATHVNITMNVIDVEASAGSTGRGRFWVMVGQESNADRILTQHARWSHMTTTVSVADKQPIKPGLRGTRQHFFPRAARERGTVAESVKTTWSSSVSMLLEFTQEAV